MIRSTESHCPRQVAAVIKPFDVRTSTSPSFRAPPCVTALDSKKKREQREREREREKRETKGNKNKKEQERDKYRSGESERRGGNDEPLGNNAAVEQQSHLGLWGIWTKVGYHRCTRASHELRNRPPQFQIAAGCNSCNSLRFSPPPASPPNEINFTVRERRARRGGKDPEANKKYFIPELGKFDRQ